MAEKFVSQENAARIAANLDERFNKRATKTEVNTLTNTVNGKADSKTVSDLTNTVSTLTNTVNNKADKTALAAKADASAVTREALVNTIGVFQGATADMDGTSGLLPAPTTDMVADSEQDTGTKIWFGQIDDATVSENAKTATLDDADGFELKNGTIVILRCPKGMDTYSRNASLNVANTGNVKLVSGVNAHLTSQSMYAVCPVGGAYPLMYYGNNWYPLGYYYSGQAAGLEAPDAD